MVQDITKGILIRKDSLEITILNGTRISPIVSLGCVNPSNVSDIAKVSGFVYNRFKTFCFIVILMIVIS